jgi:hypothetical protein
MDLDPLVSRSMFPQKLIRAAPKLRLLDGALRVSGEAGHDDGDQPR